MPSVSNEVLSDASSQASAESKSTKGKTSWMNKKLIISRKVAVAILAVFIIVVIAVGLIVGLTVSKCLDTQ